jgi:hypothetical protein
MMIVSVLLGCGDDHAMRDSGLDAAGTASDASIDAPGPLVWHDYTNGLNDPHPLYGVFVLAPDNVWFASGYDATAPGAAFVDHWNGRIWQVYGVTGVDFPLRRVWALGSAAFFAGSNSDATQGAIVAAMEDPMSATTPAVWVLRGQYGLTGIAGVPSGDYVAVGPAAYVKDAVPNGYPWSHCPTYRMPFAGATTVWLGTANDGWAASAADHVLHWDGSQWSAPSGVAGMSIPIADLWGFGSNDVWAVGGSGANGIIIHWNGANWTAVQSDALGQLEGIWGAATNDIWAVGASGRVQHWDGTGWSTVPAFTSAHLFGVHGSGPEEVWVVGENGTIFRYGR